MKRKTNFNKHFTKNDLHTYLVKYVERNFEKWRKKYLNVVGAHVGKKEVRGKPTNRFAIIFHVIDKTESIRPKERIPEFFTVTHKGRKVKVPTDLIKTGDSSLHFISPGRNVFQFGNVAKQGTMGCIVSKDGNAYLLTNMHVIGWSILSKTSVVKDRKIDFNLPPDISTLVNKKIIPFSYLRSGVVDNRVDAAIAFIPPGMYQYINPRTDLFDVDNPIVLPHQPLKVPIPVRMLGNMSGFRDSNIVSTVAVMTFNYPFGPQTLVNLIAIDPAFSQRGDSGSPVYEPFSGRIVGIVLGKDDLGRFTYVIPYHEIQSALEI